MAKSGSSAEPSSTPVHTVFIDTTLDTHLVVVVSDDDTVCDLKDKILVEHPRCFPTIGEITVNALKVRRKSCFYHLSDSMLVKNLFLGVKRCWFLYADASKSDSNRDSSLLVQLGKGDLVNQLPPEKRIGSGYNGGEVAKIGDPGLKYITDEHHKSHSSDSNKRKEPDILKKQGSDDDQHGISEINISGEKYITKKRTREMACDEIASNVPQSGYNVKKQRTNEEKAEDSFRDPVMDELNGNDFGTFVSVKNISEPDIPEKCVEDMKKVQNPNLDDLSDKGLKDDNSSSSLSLVNGKRKKKMKLSDPHEEDFTVHSSKNKARQDISKEKLTDDHNTLDKEADATFSPAHPHTILEKENHRSSDQDVGRRNLIHCKADDPNGTVAEKGAAADVQPESLGAKGLDGTCSRNVETRRLSVKELGASGGKKSKRSKKRNVCAEGPAVSLDEAPKDQSNDIREKVHEDGEFNGENTGPVATVKAEKEKALPRRGDPKEVFSEVNDSKGKSVGHDEAEMGIKDGVDPSRVSVEPFILEAGRPTDKRKKKTKKTKVTSDLKHADNSEDIISTRPRPEQVVAPEPKKAFGYDNPANDAGEQNNLFRNETAEFSKIRKVSGDEDTKTDMSDKTKTKHKTLLNNGDGVILTEAADFKSNLFDQNEADMTMTNGVSSSTPFDVSPSKGVVPSVKRKRKLKKNRPSDSKSLVIAAEDHSGNMVPVITEPDEAFDSNPGDEFDNECILSQGKRAELSRIGSNLNCKIVENEKGLAEDGDGMLFSGETNSKSKLPAQDEKEVKLQGGFGSSNPLDASGLKEAPEVTGKRRRKQKKKKDSDILHGDNFADAVKNDDAVLSQTEKAKTSMTEAGGSGDNQIPKSKVDRGMSQKGDLKAVSSEQCEAQTNICDKVAFKSFEDSSIAESKDPNDRKRKKKKTRVLDAECHLSTSGVEHDDVTPLISESDKILAGGTGNGIKKKDNHANEHTDDLFPLTQESTDRSDDKVKSKLVKNLSSTLGTLPLTEENTLKRKKTRSKRTLNQLPPVMPEAENMPSSGNLKSSEISPKNAAGGGHLVNSITYEAKDHMEFPSIDSDNVNFSDYFVAPKVVAPAKEAKEADIQQKISTEEIKARKKNKKLNANSQSSSLDLEKSYISINGPGHTKKPHDGTSNISQRQSTKDDSFPNENTCPKPQVPSHKTPTSSEAIDGVFVSQSRTAKEVNTIVSTKENSAAWDTSSSNTENTEDEVRKIKGRGAVKTPSHPVLVREANNRNTAKGLKCSSTEKSLLVTPNTIFKESSVESSEDDAVSNSDASTKTPDNSSSSDESEGGISDSPQTGFGGQLENGDKISKYELTSRKSLGSILMNSVSYKKAKDIASQSQFDDDEGEPVDLVVDSVGFF